MTVPGIDIDVLLEATGNDRTIAAELMRLFFELTGQEQARLADAVAQGNHAAASAVAHKVAGSCVACGMSGIYARFKELENLCKEAMPEDACERIQAIDRELQDARRNLEKYFNCTLVS
ncbi:MAG TPA: Hpt domain-containing protein [Pontiellaceae bacterium]|nr:Hpt domain-containing protein [Pontiellaceae bacterium]